jgi:ParB family chromosome partitioning protein
MTATAPTTTDPAQAEAELAADVQMRLEQLDPHTLLLTGNIRSVADLDPDFIKSVREYGVLVPLVAVQAPDGIQVRYGQRRTLAAIETGRPTVPVVVITGASDDEAERIIQQWHENEHRRGLSVSDQVDAAEQLAAFGLTAEQIGGKLGTKPEHVTRALAIAGSKLARKAAPRYDLTLEESAAVAEFDGHPETVKALVAAAKEGPFRFAHILQRARDERDRAALRAALTDQLTELGVPQVAQPSYNDRKVRRLDKLTGADRKRLTPAKHKSCPGHAAFIGSKQTWGSDTIVYVCTDWRANGHLEPGFSNGAQDAPPTPQQRQEASAERKRVIANNRDWRSAETVRRRFLRDFLARKTPPKGAAVFVATELAHQAWPLRDALSNSSAGLLHELTGAKNGKELAATADRSTDARAQVLALAFVLAGYEASTSTNTWRGTDPGIGRYFAFLAAAGYQLSEVEQLCLPTAPRRRKPTSEPAAAQPPAAEVQPAAEHDDQGAA